LEATGSVLITNKYTEDERDIIGCEVVDIVEQIAIDKN
jgi:glycine/serine hydroxymethyltransferase